ATDTSKYGIIADLYDRNSETKKESRQRAERPERPERSARHSFKKPKAEMQKKAHSKKGKKKANTSRFKILGK
ncbi:MAG: hypothetical protein J6W39_07820, partial [Spirochaetales bacterium]|nr:hypothetical protein [Spirochaetales bacterium]